MGLRMRSKAAKRLSKTTVRPFYRVFLFVAVALFGMWSVFRYDPSSLVHSRRSPSNYPGIKHGSERRRLATAGFAGGAESDFQCQVDQECELFTTQDECEHADNGFCEWYGVLNRCEHSSLLCSNETTNKSQCDSWCPTYHWTYYDTSSGFAAMVLYNDSNSLRVVSSGTNATLEAQILASNWTTLEAQCVDEGVICNCTGHEEIVVHDECSHEIFGVPATIRDDALHSIWILVIVVYGFIGIAIVCDTYFEPSLETISTKLKLTPDVAGATFMAMGSSAPELFTSLSDNFITQNNVGVGTIVGSALFNILIIVALSAFVARPRKGEVDDKKGIKVDWRPVVRDVLFYAISIGCLVGCIFDESVYWWEALIMILVYVCYIIFMTQNPKIMAACDKANDKRAQVAPLQAVPVTAVPVNVAANPKTQADVEAPAGPETKSADHKKSPTAGDVQGVKTSEMTKDTKEDESSKKEEGNEGGGDDDDDDDDDDDWRVWPTKEEWAEKGCGSKFWFIFVSPLHCIFWLTIPNCGNPNPCLQKLYPLTFVNCVVWMAILCALETTLVTWLGCWWEISAPVMGIVILAIGTSVPDAIASMLVARGGQGDMAIANAVGSNVFDILFGLGFPWLIADLAFASANACGELTGIYVDVDGIVGATLILFGTVLFYISVLAIMKWVLNKWSALVFLIMYLLIITVLMLNEYCAGFTWKLYNDNC